MGFKTWLRGRREEVDAAAIAQGLPKDLRPQTIVGAAKDRASEKWTQQHDAECQRQDRLTREREVDAAYRGHLLDEEITPALQQEAADLEAGLVVLNQEIVSPLTPQQA